MRNAPQVLQIHLLGDFRVVESNRPLASLNGARLQSLFAYLLLHRGAPQSRQHIAFVLWPESTESHARGSLRKLLHQLTRALKSDSFVDVNGETLQWRSDSEFTLDVEEFEKLAGAADSLPSLRLAVEYYRGDLLPSCYDEWILPERERLRQLYDTTLARIISSLERQRDYRDAINYAQTLLRHDPVHEETYRVLMRLYALSGDRAGALHVYHTCASVLERELNVDPSAETRDVYERLLNVPESGALTAATVVTPPLVGRREEWTQLQAIWHRAAAGKPICAVIAGEAGIGKTRLAEELVEWARRQGIAVATARAYASEGALAFSPIVEWLRARPLPTLASHWLSEISRLLPELLTQETRLTTSSALPEAWQREHFFEALARAILEGGQPLLLLLDDIQWCDSDTLAWLHYLLRFDPHARMLLLTTMRPEEVTADQPLFSLLAALARREQLEEISLQPLDSNETATLARQITGRELDPKIVSRLYRETEGNSLFVVEFSRAHILEQIEREAGVLLPPTVQNVIRARLAQLSPAARELASLAAVVGRTFTFEILRQVLAADDETVVRSLDELWRRRIIREQGIEGYDFTHDKLREVVYSDLSAVRRRWFHAQFAARLETLHSGNLEGASAEIATQFEKANMLKQALSYYERAAIAAQRMYANQDAIALYQHALELVGQMPSASDVSRIVVLLHEGLGDILEYSTQYDQARASYQRGLEEPHQDLLETARLHRKVGNSYGSQRRQEEALSEYNLAEKALELGRSEPVAQWWLEWINVQFDRFELQYARADVEQMTRLTEEIKPTVEQHGTGFQRAHMYRLFVQISLRRDHYIISDETLGYEQAAFMAIQEMGDSNLLSAQRFKLGFVLLWRGLLDEAEEQLIKALSWDEQVGDMNEKTLTLTYLTILYRMRGRADEARRFGLLALESATNANMVAYLATAKANLAWVAWKQGKPNEAKEQAQGAFIRWLPTFPFQWTALFPLMAIALKRHLTAEAVQYGRKLLGPHQQRLPEALTANLEQAIAAWDKGEVTTAHNFLKRGIELSRELGYL